MNDVNRVAIWFDPEREYHEAHIGPLTDKMMREQTDSAWWTERSVDPEAAANEIDRHWKWRTQAVEFDDQPLKFMQMGLITDDDLVQGGMTISIDPVPSVLAPRCQALMIEWLFTAPRNRPHLRKNDTLHPGSSTLRWYVGVGTQLLRWGAEFSRHKGYDGRVRLDASPSFVEWYESRFFQRLSVPSAFYEDVAYTPMELSAAKVDKLLELF